MSTLRESGRRQSHSRIKPISACLFGKFILTSKYTLCLLTILYRLYLLFLPFEVYEQFKWITIPGVTFAACEYDSSLRKDIMFT